MRERDRPLSTGRHATRKAGGPAGITHGDDDGWLWRCASLQEAIDWVKRCPNPMAGESEIEIRQVFEADDFGENLTPELREKEQRMCEEAARKK